MPQGAHRECRSPRCPNYAEANGYCEAHAEVATTSAYRQIWDRRLQPNNRNFCALRKSYLLRHPVCASCRTQPAGILDHIVPHRGNPDLFWRQSNWQGLCKRCHDSKTAAECWPDAARAAALTTGGHLVLLLGEASARKRNYAATFTCVVEAPDDTEAALGLAFAALAAHLAMDHEVALDLEALSAEVRRQALAIAKRHRARTTLAWFEEQSANRAVAQAINREGWQRVIRQSCSSDGPDISDPTLPNCDPTLTVSDGGPTPAVVELPRVHTQTTSRFPSCCVVADASSGNGRGAAIPRHRGHTLPEFITA